MLIVSIVEELFSESNIVARVTKWSRSLLWDLVLERVEKEQKNLGGGAKVEAGRQATVSARHAANCWFMMLVCRVIREGAPNAARL